MSEVKKKKKHTQKWLEEHPFTTRQEWLDHCTTLKREAIDKNKALVRFIREDPVMGIKQRKGGDADDPLITVVSNGKPIGAFVAYLNKGIPYYGWSLCHSKREKKWERNQAISDAYRKAQPFDMEYIKKLTNILRIRGVKISQIDSAFQAASKYFKILNELQEYSIKQESVC